MYSKKIAPFGAKQIRKINAHWNILNLVNEEVYSNQNNCSWSTDLSVIFKSNNNFKIITFMPIS